MKSNKMRDVYLWFKDGLGAIPDERERTAVADEIFLRKLDISRDKRVLLAEERLAESTLVDLIKSQKRLNQHEPVQYVTGIASFMGLDFEVRPGVLIPRQETEGLVELVLQMLHHDTGKLQKDLSILDAGTGSGCIAISIKSALPGHFVSACDQDKDILDLAKANAAKNGVRVDFFSCDILNRQDKRLKSQSFDYLVSNPPYVRESEKEVMQKQVIDHEPHSALFVPDDDPLVFYRELLKMASNTLKRNGRVFFEINEALAKECEELFLSHGYEEVKIHQDIHGRNRYLTGKISHHSG